MQKGDVVEYFLEKEILVSPEILNEKVNVEDFIGKIISRLKSKPLVFNKDLLLVVNNTDQVIDLNWLEFERSRVDVEKGRSEIIYNTFLDILNYNISEDKRIILDELMSNVSKESKVEIISEEEESECNIVVLKSFNEEVKRKEVGDFVGHFKSRYEAIKGILLSRSELQNSVSINRLMNKQEGERVSLIGIILDIRRTSNGHIIIKLEDNSGIVNVLFSKNKGELLESAGDLVLDEVVGIFGALGKDIVFANEIYFPDIPLSKELKKCKDDVYAVFVGDTHFGLNNFVKEGFLRFIKWLRGEYGNDKQREIASKIGYLFIVGDLVEGVGIYPNQDKDLFINDIYKQYEEAGYYLSQIPKNIKIVICGGNHDAMRIAEPQPAFDKRIAAPLFELSNVVLVSNPSLINIHSSSDFEGFNVLLYHGFSFVYYADNVPSLRNAGGMDASDKIMKYLLQKRHLAPTHGSNLYVADAGKDNLVIDKVPDVFVSGHIHRIGVGNYRGVSLINASCWVTQTEDQERRGIIPEPGKVPIMNLKTREVKVMNFMGEDGSK